MNAEFRRNLWLEVSPRRLVWAGVTLALIYGVVLFSIVGSPSMASDNVGLLTVAAGMVFFVCAALWGARAAAGSVLGEIADRTWDFQRLSALTPWQMTWGKLFGATSLAWICGLSGLVMMAFAASQSSLPSPGLGWHMIWMTASALLLQAVCMGAALIGVRKARAEGRPARAGGVFGGLLAAGLLLSFANSQSAQSEGGLFSALTSDAGRHAWWGVSLDASIFRALAMAAFAGWALAGAWRLMRLELQMRNAPVVWPAFLLFLAVFVGGLGDGARNAVMVLGLAAYAAAFAEPADRVRLRQFIGALRAKAFARALPLIPAPVAPVAMMTLIVAGVAISLPGRPFGAPDWALGLASLAFLLRDLAVIFLLRFGGRPARGDIGAVIALAVLYGVGAVIGASSHVEAALFAPSAETPLASLAAGLVQAAVAWALAGRRILAPPAPLSPPAAASG